MKYYLCGEYGESNMRPHYHVIFLAWFVRTKSPGQLGFWFYVFPSIVF